MGCQLCQEFAMAAGVSGLAEVLVGYIHSVPHIHQVGHLAMVASELQCCLLTAIFLLLSKVHYQKDSPD